MGEFSSQAEQKNKTATLAPVPEEISSTGELEYVDTRASTAQLISLQAAADGRSNRSTTAQLQAKALSHAGNSRIAQLQALSDSRPTPAKNNPIQRQENKTGLPDQLKSGMESLSGLSLSDVKVHRNSDKPAQLQAHAYAQGTDIHLGPGQEKHLPHELGHVVQQKQGRVKPTMQLKGKVNINDDAGLEKEADVLGAKAIQLKKDNNIKTLQQREIIPKTTQLVLENPLGLFEEEKYENPLGLFEEDDENPLGLFEEIESESENIEILNQLYKEVNKVEEETGSPLDFEAILQSNALGADSANPEGAADTLATTSVAEDTQGIVGEGSDQQEADIDLGIMGISSLISIFSAGLNAGKEIQCYKDADLVGAAFYNGKVSESGEAVAMQALHYLVPILGALKQMYDHAEAARSTEEKLKHLDSLTIELQNTRKGTEALLKSGETLKIADGKPVELKVMLLEIKEILVVVQWIHKKLGKKLAKNFVQGTTAGASVLLPGLNIVGGIGFTGYTALNKIWKVFTGKGKRKQMAKTIINLYKKDPKNGLVRATMKIMDVNDGDLMSKSNLAIVMDALKS